MNALTGIGSREGRTVYRLYHADGTAAGTFSVTKSTGSQGKKKKRLPYNFKEISVRILQSKTSGNARQVLTYARGQAALLRQKLKSGEYDDSELVNAVIHAEKMVRIAKKRMKHLKEEEKAEKNGGPDFDLEEAAKAQEARGQDGEALPEQMQELTEAFGEELTRELTEELSRKLLEDLGSLEELAEEFLEEPLKEMEPEDIKLLKKKHRSDELKDIMEADMKYLKAMFDRLAKEKAESGRSSASLSLGGVEMPVPVMPAEEPVMIEGGNMDILC